MTPPPTGWWPPIPPPTAGGVVDYRSRPGPEEGYHWYRAHYCHVPDLDAGEGHIMGLCLDVEEEKRLATRLVEAATDGVCGLWGRAAAESRISAAMAEDSRPYACFLYDIDNFKQVNDTFGHLAGDRLLVRVGQVLRGAFREGDILGRLGGDEFVVLMRGVTDPELVRERANATVRAIQNISRGEEGYLPISVSLGVAYDGGACRDFCQMYRLADKALYRAKRAGKNRHVFLDLEAALTPGGAAE